MAIHVPGHGDIEPLSKEAEVLVQSEDAEHVGAGDASLTTARQPHPRAVPRVLQARLGDGHGRRDQYAFWVSCCVEYSPRPLVYLAPSGVQKERILPEHMFVLPFAQSSVPKPGSKRDFVRIPSKKGLSESQCTPLFWNAFTQRDAVSCIHTHSQNAVMLTLLLGKDAKSFRISHQEMIKGVRLGGVGKTLAYFNTLEVPIIENTAREEDLTESMAAAMEQYPDAAAILVRRHGVYIWGGER